MRRQAALAPALALALALVFETAHAHALVADRFVGVVRVRTSELRVCYVRALALRPGLAGRLTLSFEVDPSGLVTAARATDDTAGDRGVSECALAAVRTWTFPPSPGADVETVTYPFTFAP